MVWLLTGRSVVPPKISMVRYFQAVRENDWKGSVGRHFQTRTTFTEIGWTDCQKIVMCDRAFRQHPKWRISTK